MANNPNITTLLDKSATRVPNRAALIINDSFISFAELATSVQQCANLLTAKGLRKNDRAIIMIPMSPDLYIVMLAIIRCGATAVFVDPWIPMKQIAAFSAFADPTAFIGIPKSHILRLLEPKLKRIPITATTGFTFTGIPAKFSINKMQQQAKEHCASFVEKNTPALITFTSGSSGIPKGANRTHGFLIAQYEALCSELDYNDDDIDMPMFPVFALRNLAAGITSVIPEMDFKNVDAIPAERIVQQIKDHNVTMLTASPPFIDQLALCPTPIELRKIYTGGAPVRAAQLKTWNKRFPNTHVEIIYGSTEAEPVAHITSHERLKSEGNEGYCCGKPTDRLQTRIIQIRKERIHADELEKVTLPQGKIGELIVSGKHVCRDYFNNPDAVLENKIIEQNNTCWHRMGDTGYFDEQGRFFLTGRVHSTITRKGEILHAQLIEAEAMQNFPKAIRIAALERDDQLWIIIQVKQMPDRKPSIDADEIRITTKELPLDPRHKSKIDYNKLELLLDKGII